VVGERPPSWALSGFVDLPTGLPWALSDSGKSVAYLFARQLVAGNTREDGTSNKVLWVTKGNGPARISARLLDANVPDVEIRGQVTNGNQTPTLVDLPSPGCWTFDLAWGRTKDRIQLQVLPEGSLPTQPVTPASPTA